MLVVCLIVFNATFDNISAISWRSLKLVRETGDQEKTTDLSQVTDKLDHIMFYISPWSRFEPTKSGVIGTDFIGSCKSNFHTITATCVLLYLDIREQPFNLKGLIWFYPKKIFWFPMLLKKIFWFWWRKIKKSDSEFLSYNLMLNSGKKFRALCDKENKYSNSCVVRK